MRRFPSSWTTTLTRLGLRRRKASRKREQHRGRRARLEPLEARQMLASDVYTVTTLDDVVDANDNLLSLREAIDLAATDGSTTDNDIIRFDRSLFDGEVETIALEDQDGDNSAPESLLITSTLTVEGPGADLLSISGGGLTRVVKVEAGANVTLSHLTVRDGGGTSYGGGIHSAGDLTLDHVEVSDNIATSQGGGLRSLQGNLTIIASTFERNEAELGAGVYRDVPGTGVTRIEASTFTDNEAFATTSVHKGNGGAIYLAGNSGHDVDILNSTFSNNRAVKGGAMMIYDGFSVEIVHTTITDNHANPNGMASTVNTSGGGIHAQGSADITVYNSIIAGNTSSNEYRSNMYAVNSTTAESSHNVVQQNKLSTHIGGLDPTTNTVLLWTETAGLMQLGDYGGATLTHGVLQEGPAAIAGSVQVAQDYGLVGDQRTSTSAITDRVYYVDIANGVGTTSAGSVEASTLPIAATRPFLVNNDFSTGAQANSWVATNSSGQTAVAWRGVNGVDDEGDGLYVQIVNPSSVETSLPRRVDTEGATTGGNAQDIQTVIDADGKLAVTWRTPDDNLYLRRYETNGNPIDELPLLVAQDATEASSVVNGSGRLIVFWKNSDSELVFRRFSSSGLNYDASPRIAINDNGESSFANTSRRTAAIGSAGDFYVSYRQTGVLYLQHFSAGGIADGMPIEFASADSIPDLEVPSGMQDQGSLVIPYDIIADGQGNVAVSWLYSVNWFDSVELDYVGEHKLAIRRYSPVSGLGSETEIARGSTTTSEDYLQHESLTQNTPGLATDQFGRLGVTWMQRETFDNGATSSNTVHTAWFHENGEQVVRKAYQSEEFDELNVPASLDAKQPSLSSDAFGNFVLTGTVDDDIYAQRFSLPNPITIDSSGLLTVDDTLTSQYDEIVLSAINVRGVDIVAFNEQPTSIRANQVTSIAIHGGSNSSRIDVSRVTPENFTNLPASGTGVILVQAGDGDDTVFGSSFSDILQGEGGADRIFSNGGEDSIYGGAGADILTGSEGTQTLEGGDGDDILRGGEGDDTLRGDADDDQLFGDAGDDMIYGGDGADRLDGGLGFYETLYGDAGDDVFVVSDALTGDGTTIEWVLVDGAEGQDTIDFSSASSAVSASLDTLPFLAFYNRNVAIPSNGSIENVIGTAYGDIIKGNALNNRLVGGGGDDTLSGVPEEEAFVGAGGDDQLIGGAGDDTYKLQPHAGNVEIVDFSGGADKLDQGTFPAEDRIDWNTIDYTAGGTIAFGGPIAVTLAVNGLGAIETWVGDPAPPNAAPIVGINVETTIVNDVIATITYSDSDPPSYTTAGWAAAVSDISFINHSQTGAELRWINRPTSGTYRIPITVSDGYSTVSDVVEVSFGDPLAGPAFTLPSFNNPINEGELLSIDLSDASPSQFYTLDYDAPVGVAIVEIMDQLKLEWTPTDEQIGEHSFYVHLTETPTNGPPLRSSQLVTVTVNDVNTVPVIVPGSLALVHDTVGSSGNDQVGVTSNLTLAGEVTNDGSVELVEIEVIYNYDGTFDDAEVDDAFEVVASEDDPELGTFLIQPSAQQIAALLGSPTTIAVRAREWNADLNNGDGAYAYSTDDGSSPVTITVTPDATENQKPVVTANVTHLTGINNGQYLGTYNPVIEGSVTNDGPLDGLTVKIYDLTTSDLLETIRVEPDGTFTFTPLGLSDQEPDQSYYVVAEEIVPILGPSADPVESVEVEVKLQYQQLVAPNITSPITANAVRTNDLAVSNSISGGTLSDYSNATIEFVSRIDDQAADPFLDPINGVTVADESGAFTYLPVGLTSQDGAGQNEETHVYARTVVWDDYQKTTVYGQVDKVAAFIYDASAIAAPDISPLQFKYAAENYDGTTPLHDATVVGQVSRSGNSLAGSLVEFSIIPASDTTTQAFAGLDEPEGFAVTDAEGNFEFTPLNLDVDEQYTIYARAVDSDPDLDSPLASNQTVSASFSLTSDAPAVPPITAFGMKFDTGIVQTADLIVTADPTVYGTVAYDGDMEDLVIELDLNNDATPDVFLTPAADGSFEYTPEGFEDTPYNATPESIRARVRVPNYTVRTPEFDQALLDAGWFTQTYDSANYSWADDSDTGTPDGGIAGNGVPDFVDEWFADLYAEDGVSLEGEWYTSDFARDWESLFDDPVSPEWSTTTFLLDSEEIIETFSLGVADLVVGVNGLPIVSGNLTGTSQTSGVVVHFYLNGSIEPDGSAVTDENGEFHYALRNHVVGTSTNQLVVKAERPRYESEPAIDTLTPTPIPFNVGHDGTLAVTQFGLADPIGINAQGETTAKVPRLIGTVSTNDDVALKTVEFDYNGDGIADASTLTDGLGQFEYLPVGFGTGIGSFTFNARVTETRTHVLDGGTPNNTDDDVVVDYQASGDWTPLTWEAVENDEPVIERFELEFDTGDPALLDRVTSDPTLVGRVSNDNGAAFITVEFTHTYDSVVDDDAQTVHGTATTDANGYFRYTPEGLFAGSWDVRARVVETDSVTGDQISTGWRAVVADGAPSDGVNDGAFVGFTLVAPTAASGLAFHGFANTENANQVDPTLKGSVGADPDGFGNLTIEFYFENATEPFGSTSDVDEQGNFVYTPIGVPAWSAGTKIFVKAYEADFLTSQRVESASTTPDDLGTPVGHSQLSASTPVLDAESPLSDQVFSGFVSTVTQTTGGVTVNLIEPVLAEVYSSSAGSPDEFFTTVPITPSINASGVVTYEYEFRPGEFELTNAVQFQVRPVGVNEHGYVFGTFSSSSTSYATPAASIQPGWTILNAGGEELQPTLDAEVTDNLPATTTQYDIEFDFDNDGIADDTLILDEYERIDYEFSDLEPGEVSLQARVIANITRTVSSEEVYERFEGQWQPIDFTLANPAPKFQQIELDGGLQVSPVDTTQSNDLGESKSQTITGRIASLLTTVDSPLGMAVEFDENLDGVVDGTAVADHHGNFEYELQTVEVGDVVIRARTVDSYSDTRPLVGDWVDLSFELKAKEAPVVNSEYVLRQIEGEHDPDGSVTGDEIPITRQPVIEGTVTVADYVGQVIVEFDHNGNALADGYATADLFGNFTYTPDNLPFGVANIAARAVVQSGTSRIEGDWSSEYVDNDLGDGIDRSAFTIDFFHQSVDAPVITQFEVDEDTPRFVTGRAVVNGYGQAVQVEIAVGTEQNHVTKRVVNTDSNGYFRAEVPELTFGTHTIIVRGLTPDPNSNSVAVGQWSSEVTLTYDPFTLTTTPTITQFGLAYGSTAGTADPTVSGIVDTPWPETYVEFRYGTSGDVDGMVRVRADGTFEHTPSGLAETSHTIQARIRYWNPDASGGFVEGTFGSTNETTFSLTATAQTSPSITAFKPLGTPGIGIAQISEPIFEGQLVTGDYSTLGIELRFDYNGDGLIDGRTLAKADGSFLYDATGLEPGTIEQQITVYAVLTDYWGQEHTATDTVDFILTRAPLVHELNYDGANQTVDGKVFSIADFGDVQIEHHFFGDGTTFPNVPDGSGGSYDYTPTLTTATAVNPDFEFSVQADASGATGMLVRAVEHAGTANELVGPWKYVELVSPQATPLNVADFEIAHFDNPVNRNTSDPTVIGRLGAAGEGAFGVVEISVQELDAMGDPIGNAAIYRRSANNLGEFSFTPPDLADGSEYTLSARSVVYDPASGQELFSPFTTLSGSFTLVDAAFSTILSNSFGLKYPAANPTDPTLVGTVTNTSGRRLSGLRVEFDTDNNEEPDGFAFTDANGDFEFTPHGLVAGTPYTIRARVVEWDAIAREFHSPLFSDPSTQQMTFTLDGAYEEPEFDDVLLDDTVAATLADESFQQVINQLAELHGIWSTSDYSVDIGFGHIGLLYPNEGDVRDDDALPTERVLALNGSGEPLAYDTGNVSLVDQTYIENGLDLSATGGFGTVTATIDVLHDAHYGGTGTYNPESDLLFTITDFQHTLSNNTNAEGITEVQTLVMNGSYRFVVHSSINPNGGIYALLEDIEYDYWIETETFDASQSSTDPVTTVTSTGDYEFAYNENSFSTSHVGGTYLTSGAPGSGGDIDHSVTPAYASMTEVIRIETWNVESTVEQINTDVRVGTRTSSVDEHSLYHETRTSSTFGANVYSIQVSAYGLFDGTYSDSLEYTDTFTDGGYEEAEESSSQSVHYDGSLSAIISYAGDTRSVSYNFSDRLNSSFTASGSGISADYPQGQIPTSGNHQSESWNYHASGDLEGGLTVAGSATRTPGSDGGSSALDSPAIETVDAAFSSYGSARIDGRSSGTVSYTSDGTDGTSSGSGSGSFSFNSQASASVQGTHSRVNDDYTTAGTGDVDYSGGFTATSSGNARTNRDTPTDSLHANASSRTGTAGSVSGGVAFDYIYTNEGDFVDGTFGTSLMGSASTASDSHGTYTDKGDSADASDNVTTPFRDNEAGTYEITLSHSGNFSEDTRSDDASPGLATGDSQSSGQVTRTQTWTNTSGNYAGLARPEDIEDLPPLAAAVGGSGGSSRQRDHSERTLSERFSYSDDNGDVERQGSFDDTTEGKRERTDEVSYSDENATYAHREDSGGESQRRLQGSFTDDNGVYTADATVDSNSDAYRSSQTSFSTLDNDAGNRSGESFQTSTLGKANEEYTGSAQLEGDEVTSGAGNDKSNQLGRVSNRGNSFNESTTNEGGTTTHSASSGGGNSRTEQTASGQGSSTDGNNATGTASASQSGHSRGNGSSATTSVTGSGDNRTKETLTNSGSNSGKSRSSATGSTSRDDNGTDSNYSVNSNQGGNSGGTTTRKRQELTPTSASDSSVTRTDDSGGNLKGSATVTQEDGRVDVDSGPTTGDANSGGKVNYNHIGNRRDLGGAGQPSRFFYENGNGEVQGDINLGFGADQEDVEETADAHASLNRTNQENGTDIEGWFSRGDGSSNNEQQGERITRKVNGKVTDSASATWEDDEAKLADLTTNGKRTDELIRHTWKNSKSNDGKTVHKIDNTTTSKIIISFDAGQQPSDASLTETQIVTWDKLDETTTEQSKVVGDPQTFTYPTGAIDHSTKVTTTEDHTKTTDTGTHTQSQTSTGGGRALLSIQRHRETDHFDGEVVTEEVTGNVTYNGDTFDYQYITESKDGELDNSTEDSSYYSQHTVGSGVIGDTLAGSNRVQNGKYNATTYRKVTSGNLDETISSGKQVKEGVGEFGLFIYDNWYKRDSQLSDATEQTLNNRESGSYWDSPSGKRRMEGEYNLVDDTFVGFITENDDRFKQTLIDPTPGGGTELVFHRDYDYESDNRVGKKAEITQTGDFSLFHHKRDKREVIDDGEFWHYVEETKTDTQKNKTTATLTLNNTRTIRDTKTGKRSTKTGTESKIHGERSISGGTGTLVDVNIRDWTGHIDETIEVPDNGTPVSFDFRYDSNASTTSQGPKSRGSKGEQSYGTLEAGTGSSRSKVFRPRLVGWDRAPSATDLINLGRALPDDARIHAPTELEQQLVQHGRELRDALPVPRAGGFHDDFGWHQSFCMSCHDPGNKASRLKMAVARETLTTWEAQLTMFAVGEVMAAPMGIAAAGMLPARFAAPQAVRQGHTRVYRAVSEAEYQDILKSGQLRQGPNSLEGKWFADSLEGARLHGDDLFPNGDFRLIEVDIPDSASSLYKHPDLDGFGPARYLDNSDLPNLSPRPID